MFSVFLPLSEKSRKQLVILFFALVFGRSLNIDEDSVIPDNLNVLPAYPQLFSPVTEEFASVADNECRKPARLGFNLNIARTTEPYSVTKVNNFLFANFSYVAFHNLTRIIYAAEVRNMLCFSLLSLANAFNLW